MKALLLAAGYGTRLRPLTDEIPKCLVPIRGRPLLEHWLDLIFKGGVERALVNTHYLPDKAQEFIASSRWRDRVDLVHESELLGTGGTVLANREWLGREPFLVAHADNLTLFALREFVSRHASRPEECPMTMMTFDTDAPNSCGIVEEDHRGVVMRFHEKATNPPGTRANAAVYVFEPEVVNFLDSLGKIVIDLSTEVLPHFLGRIYTFHNALYHRDIGTPESLARAEAEFPE